MSSEQLITRLDALSQIAQSFPEICYLGNPILRTPTTPATLDEGKTIGEKLGQVLMKYRQIAGYGRGLAANQIGIAKSVFVTFLDDQIQTYINPQIIKFSEDQCLYRELCLSSGFIWADIRRPAAVTLQWQNTKGQIMQEAATGPKARIFQHEPEHLTGGYSLDHAEPHSLELCLSDPLKETIRPL